MKWVFININWYIALIFCLFFFIGGRQLAEVHDGTPRSRRVFGFILFIFAAPSFLFPLAYMSDSIAVAPWYNAFRSINRIELFSALLAPFAGYATYRKPDPIYRMRRASLPDFLIRAIKPLAFPFCILFVSVNFIRPLLLPIDKETAFSDIWTESGVFIQSTASASGPASLINAMYAINKFVDSEYEVVKGTYTDRAGSEFWHIARYANNRGYRTKFIATSEVGDAPVPSIIPVSRLSRDHGVTAGTAGTAWTAGTAATAGMAGMTGIAGTRAFVVLLGHTESGALIVGDPSAGGLEISQWDFISMYGEPRLILALSAPRVR